MSWFKKKDQQEAAPSTAPEKKQGLFSRLFDGMKKTRDQLSTTINNLLSGGELDDDFYEELEYAMIAADMGATIASEVTQDLKRQASADKLRTATDVRDALKAALSARMQGEAFAIDTPCVLLIVGVNGVGKTTSIGKLAHHYKGQGHSVLIAAGDTFRAAAAEQLATWAQRADVPLVRHQEGADPAAVVFDAIASGKARQVDLIIVDTAGRLHNKTHLMEELKKMRRVIEREHPQAQVKTLLVMDATTGQNGLNQAQVFGESVGLDGIVLTKLDGTAKGGVAIAVRAATGLPVAFIGVGEGIDDLQPFDAAAYIDAIV